MARNYAALPWEYRREMSALNDAEFGRLCRALLEYSELGTPLALGGNERFFAERVMMQEDRYKASYDEAVATASERGKAGAKARWSNAKDARACESMLKHSEACTGMHKDACDGKTETETEIKTETAPLPPDGGKRKRRFAAPTVEEVAAYCRERGNAVDAGRFVDFYASKGWKVGREPMRDWKAAVRTWERREKPAAQTSADAPGGLELRMLRKLHGGGG